MTESILALTELTFHDTMVIVGTSPEASAGERPLIMVTLRSTQMHNYHSDMHNCIDPRMSGLHTNHALVFGA